MKILIAILGCLTLPSMAVASPIDERARQIETLANTFEYDGADVIPTASASVLFLEGCVMQSIQTHLGSFGHYAILESVNDLRSITFGLSTDSDVVEFVETDPDTGTFIGFIHFRSNTGRIRVTAHQASHVMLAPRAALARNVKRSVDFGSWRYATDRRTVDEISLLATALLAYQRDFCTPMS